MSRIEANCCYAHRGQTNATTLAIRVREISKSRLSRASPQIPREPRQDGAGAAADVEKRHIETDGGRAPNGRDGRRSTPSGI